MKSQPKVTQLSNTLIPLFETMEKIKGLNELLSFTNRQIERIANRTEQYQILVKDLKKGNPLIPQLDKEIKSKSAKIESEYKKIKGKKLQLKGLQQSYKKSTQEYIKLYGKVEYGDKKVKQIVPGEIDKKVEQLYKAEDNADEAQSKISCLAQEIQQLAQSKKQEKKKLQATFDAAKKQHQEWKRKAKDLTKQVQHLKKTLQKLQNDLPKQQLAIDLLKSEIKNLDDQIRLEEQLLEQLEMDKSHIQKEQNLEIEKKEMKLKEFQAEQETLEKEEKQYKKEIKALEKQFEQGKKKLQAKKDQLLKGETEIGKKALQKKFDQIWSLWAY